MVVTGPHGLEKADGEQPINVVFPEGTHAIRWIDPAAWFWLKDGEVVTSDMLYSSDSTAIDEYWEEGEGANLGPVRFYTYTAGLLVEPPEQPYFEFPLTGQYEYMHLADVVDTFVIQVMSAADIEYLDEENSPIHPGDLPEMPEFPDPPSADPCEITPQFCEYDLSLWSTPCQEWHLCAEQEKMEIGLIRVKDLSGAITLHLRVLHAILHAGCSPVEQGYKRSALHKAQARMASALKYGNAADAARKDYLAKLRTHTKSPHTARFAGDVSLNVHLGLRALARCAARLDKARQGNLATALRDSELAYDHFSVALDQALRMKAWALAAEVYELASGDKRPTRK